MPGHMEFINFLVRSVIDLVSSAVYDDGALRSMHCNAAVTAVGLLAVAAVALPGNHLVRIVEGDVQRVVELPVIMRRVPAAVRAHTARILGAEGPARHVDLMGSVVQRLAGAPHLE